MVYWLEIERSHFSSLCRREIDYCFYASVPTQCSLVPRTRSLSEVVSQPLGGVRFKTEWQTLLLQVQGSEKQRWMPKQVAAGGLKSVFIVVDWPCMEAPVAFLILWLLCIYKQIRSCTNWALMGSLRSSWWGLLRSLLLCYIIITAVPLEGIVAGLPLLRRSP